MVATPGRLLDLIDQRLVRLGEIHTLVLDEFDRMLDQGFLPAIKRVLQRAARAAPDVAVLGDHAGADRSPS